MGDHHAPFYAQAIENALTSLRQLLAIKPERLNRKVIDSIKSNLGEIVDASSELCKHKDGLLIALNNRIEALESDNSRKQLVADHSLLGSIQQLWSDLRDSQSSYEALLNTRNKFDAIVNDYVESSNANVSHRFELVSADVQTCFEILEADTEGLCNPKLRLLTDEDRAVELQVEFRGEPVCPAYRYLSESQLNSFGLSIFLASVRYFNRGFKFLLLDDVINSFDGYKRPKVIEILKSQFPEHQILLLTHDNVWSERLFEACPSWIKRRFSRYEPHIGPLDSEGFAPLEIIMKLLDEDEPVRAGQYMGPFLERQIQELCECFETLVRYNQRNEYSLDPLLDRFRVRVKDKLKEAHPLYTAVEDLQNELGFRNLSAHWKNPSIQITREEMSAVVDKWMVIEALIRCQERNCYSFVRYDNKAAFVCSCGKTRLESK